MKDMKLNRVTLTGADDTVKPGDLFDIFARYPFVEWGILLSRTRMGQPRYPSTAWLMELSFECERREIGINLSVHLCGGLVREIVRGDDSAFHDFDVPLSLAHRIQLNFAGQHVDVDRHAFGQVLKRHARYQYVFQLEGRNEGLFDAALESLKLNAAGLFDCSGGRGVTPETWPSPKWLAIDHSYAGGLGPDNIEAELPRICAAHSASGSSSDFGVDMESKVRDEEDRFDLFRCEKVLERCAPFVRQSQTL